MSQDLPLELHPTLSPKIPTTNAPRHSVQNDMERGSNDVNNMSFDGHQDVDDSAQVKANPNIVDWDGPNDSANPLNWSKRIRIGHVALVSIITLIA